MLRFPVLLALCLGGPLAIGADVIPAVRGTSADRQDPPSDERLALLRERLRQPGREGEEQRRAAVVQLMSTPEVAAHALLREFVEEIDEDGVALTILRELAERLGNADDPVFGPNAAQAPLRAQLLLGYLPPLVRLVSVAQDPAARLAADQRAELSQAVRSALRLLPLAERREGFMALLADSDVARRAAAVRAIPECADLNLAPILAGLLGDSDLGAVAREALFNLTFRDFASKDEFAAWYATAPKRYQDLTEQTARNSLEVTAQLRRDFEEQRRALVVELIETLVATSQNVQWKRIHDHLRHNPVDVLVASLDKLRALLAAKEDYAKSGVDADRLALFNDLTGRYDELAKKGNGIDKRAVLLEVCAYLVRSDESERRDAMKVRLKLALEEPAARLRIAAAAGLARYAAPDTMRALLATGRQAASASPPERELLQACLHTLSGWEAPSDEAVLAEWIGLLEHSLLDPRLPSEVHRVALKVIDRRDANKARPQAAFELLEKLVANAELDVSLRTMALSYLLGFATDPVRTEAFVSRLTECMRTENHEQVRIAAAQLLRKLPAELGTADLSRTLAVAEASLRDDPSEAVVSDLATSLKQLAQRFPYEVIDRLSEVVEQLGREPRAARRALLVDALKVLAMDLERQPPSWVRAGEALLELGDRDSLRQVLVRQFRAVAQPKPDVEADIIARGMQLVLGAARLKPAEVPWRDLKEEAEQVRVAFDHLKGQDKAQSADGELAVLRIEVLVGLGRDQQALAELDALGQAVLAAPLAERLSIAAAQACLRLGRLAEAASRMGVGRGNGNGAPPSAASLDLQTQLAAKWLAERPKDAADLLAHVLQHTPEARDEYVERMLLLARARLAADPSSGAEVARLLEGKRELVRKKGSVELEAQYAELIRQALGNG
jgi:hypothetical protein